MGIEKAKNYWFADDLVAYAIWDESGHEVSALPKIEVERGLRYLHKLKACKTYGEAQKLFLDYRNDPLAPKLIPRIEDLSQHYEFLFELCSAHNTQIPHNQDSENYADEDPTVDELLSNIEGHKFIWNDAEPYLDDNGSFAACRNIQIWTDAWIPAEVAQVAGSPDDGFGIDYYEAELVYKNKELFVSNFKKYDIEIVFNHPELLELAGYVWEVTN